SLFIYFLFMGLAILPRVFNWVVLGARWQHWEGCRISYTESIRRRLLYCEGGALKISWFLRISALHELPRPVPQIGSKPHSELTGSGSTRLTIEEPGKWGRCSWCCGEYVEAVQVFMDRSKFVVQIFNPIFQTSGPI